MPIVVPGPGRRHPGSMNARNLLESLDGVDLHGVVPGP
jgi:hypothetical protein